MLTRVPRRLRITDELHQKFDEEATVLSRSSGDDLIVGWPHGKGTDRLEFDSARALGVRLDNWKAGDQFVGYLKRRGIVEVLVTMLE